MHHLRLPLMLLNILLSFAGTEGFAQAQTARKQLLINPFQNKVFIKEQGQFSRTAGESKTTLPEPVLYGLENAEFNAYFTQHGIIFQFPERRNMTEKEREKEREKEGKKENEESEESEGKTVETTWHNAQMLWLNANPTAEIVAQEKVSEYYNYGGYGDDTSINFVPAFKKLKYINLYPGVDVEFELSDVGGIKYKFIVQPNVEIPTIAFQWNGINTLSTDENGDLQIKSKFGLKATNPTWQLIDHSPNAYTLLSHTNIPVKYSVTGTTVKFQFSSPKISSAEGIVIDPWITNPNFPGLNKAYDIQEDSLGNVVVHGNYSQSSNSNSYHVQKYSPAGALLWTYITYSVFLGDIAVDNPGNVYLIGGYCTGKRQKLNPGGVQQWSLSGLCEEWRLAFNYSKTTLAVCGYFVNPGGNNLAKLDLATGAISNQIAYNEETRSISTDCNGDMYSLHLPSSNLRKTNANFTPAGVVPSGLSLIYSGTGYAYNPDYSPSIFQGFNGNIIQGPYVYIYDGTKLRRFYKANLTFVNEVIVPNGVNYHCSGLAADPCGNIYAGTTNSIVVYDSALTYLSTISTTGAVYDVLLSSTGNILACGVGFVGNFSTNCITPAALTATATVNYNCTPGSATIVPTGGVLPYSYNWQPGGQTTATATNLTAGTYTYTVSDPFCHNFSGTVVINQSPVARFGRTSVCNSTATQFTDSSTTSAGTIASHTWNFGDGSPVNTNPSPSYTYPNAGNYTATLIVNNNFGCADTISKPVKVFYNPISSFTHTNVCLRDSMHFVNTSTVDPSTTILSYLWVFGDGSATSNLKNPAHYYSTHGVYTVTLVTTTVDGCSDASIDSVKTFDPPQSLFTFSNTCLLNSALFTNTTVAPTMGATANWSWDFGDGSPLNTSVLSPQHLYPLPGNYQVTLITHSTNLGCPDTLQSSITVYPMPVSKFSFANVCLHDPMHFNDSSTVATGTIASVAWDFGDGTLFSTLQNPNHIYTNPGTDNVSLIVTTDHGCKDTITKTVVVHPLPIAQFSSVNECDGTAIQFTDHSSILSTDTINSNTWNFGDNNSATNQNPSHLYATAGSYTVKLLIVSNFGCRDSISKISIVNPNPVVGFTAPDTVGCEPLCVNFSETSTILTGSNTHWLWNIGDGSPTSNLQNLIHCYINDSIFSPNFFNVTLTVISDSGCISTKTKNNYITVYPNPIAGFKVQPESTTITDPVISFTNQSVGADFWKWNFGDTTTSSLQHPANYTYQDTGAYVIRLIASTQYYCADTAYKTVIIEPDFLFYIPNAFTPDGDGINDTFTGKGIFLKDFEMMIYDRWGNLIFYSDDITKPWDGHANHGAEMAQRDAYVYKINVTDYTRKKHNYKGIVTLVR